VRLRNAEHAWPQEFSNSKTVEDIIIKHSNFVNFPIFLNGKQVRAVVRRGVSTAQ
jgi:HSP90 family molecular chaperone